MSANNQIKNINEFIIAFLNKCGEDEKDIGETLSAWQEEANQEAFAACMAKLVKAAGKGGAAKAQKLKDPNAPKRPRNVYMLFCADYRENAKEVLNDGAKAPDVARELGKMWKALCESKNASDKKEYDKYQKAAADEKARYEEDMKKYKRPCEEELECLVVNKKRAGKGAANKKDPNSPKRPKNGYMFFCAEHRDEAKAALDDDAKATDIARQLGAMWRALGESSKPEDKKLLAKYQAMTEDDKARYKAEMKDYVPSDNKDDSPKKAPKAFKKDAVKPSPVKKYSAYAIFCDEHRDAVKEELGDEAKARDITKKLSEMWKVLDKDEKKEYEEKAKA